MTAPSNTPSQPPPIKRHRHDGMHHTDDVIVIGDGPAGITAALFLAKNHMGVHVLGTDQTPMHKAELHNYPGMPATPGAEVMHTARQQVEDHGGHLHHAKAATVETNDDTFRVSTDEGDTFTGRYLVLATGKSDAIAQALGLATHDGGVAIDLHGRTSHDRIYAGGNLARGTTQAVTSMGDGAAIALDILSREAGRPVHDYDVVKPPSQRTTP